jgi:hypothetical protein
VSLPKAQVTSGFRGFVRRSGTASAASHAAGGAHAAAPCSTLRCAAPAAVPAFATRSAVTPSESPRGAFAPLAPPARSCGACCGAARAPRARQHAACAKLRPATASASAAPACTSAPALHCQRPCALSALCGTACAARRMRAACTARAAGALHAGAPAAPPASHAAPSCVIKTHPVKERERFPTTQREQQARRRRLVRLRWRVRGCM